MLAAAMLLAAATFAQSASALPPGQVLPPRDSGPVDPVVYGTFKAKVKQYNPRYVNGQFQGWTYFDITANLMMYCESQFATLMNGYNMVAVDYCHQVD